MKNLRSKKFWGMVVSNTLIFVGIFSKLFFTEQIIAPEIGLPTILAIFGWWAKMDVDEKKAGLQ